MPPFSAFGIGVVPALAFALALALTYALARRSSAPRRPR